MFSRAGQAVCLLKYVVYARLDLAGCEDRWQECVASVRAFLVGSPDGSNLSTPTDAVEWDDDVIEWMLSGGMYRHQAHRGGPSYDPHPVRAIDLLKRAHALLGTLVPPTKVSSDLALRIGKFLEDAPADVRMDPSGFFDYCEACRDWIKEL